MEPPSPLVRRTSSTRSPSFPQAVHVPSNIPATRPTPLSSPYPDAMSHSQAIESGTISHPSSHADHSGKSNVADSDSGLQTQPTFQPFFTLLEDRTTNQHFHPEVQYIFSDDDGDEIIEAVGQLEELRAEYDAAIGQRNVKMEPEINERFIVVKLGADGTSVDTAYSLNSDWQVIDVSVEDAPMLDSGREESEQQRSLMLKIQGVGEVSGMDVGKGMTGMDAQSIESEVRGFIIKMNELGRVVDRAEKGFLDAATTAHAQAIESEARDE